MNRIKHLKKIFFSKTKLACGLYYLGFKPFQSIFRKTESLELRKVFNALNNRTTICAYNSAKVSNPEKKPCSDL